ncbi:hypothetical protein [Dankookia sp. P2]|uniref:hypothetical protein n=1 Tax=Dankookia sp. P2 TaxID=3423955 RepID=UPI003D677B63
MHDSDEGPQDAARWPAPCAAGINAPMSRAALCAFVLRGTVALDTDVRQGIGALAALCGPGLQIMLDTASDTLGAAMLAGGVLLTTLRQENRKAAAIAFKAWRDEAGGNHEHC